MARWERRIQGLPDPALAWKLNNNHIGFYTRLFIHQRPSWDNYLETRRGRYVDKFQPWREA